MTIKVKHSLLAASVAVALASPMTVLATNGMNMEGWGPIATGMGGASMAYDNGVAAIMNNPATLGLMDDGEGRLDVALGHLSPDINNSFSPAPDAKSGGDSYYMPAAGYAVRSGQLTYGVGMFAQGGMGTEYDATSFLAAGSGEAVRSEVGVGRLVAPIVYNLNKDITVGGSIDYVWGGMDLKMALAGAQLWDFTDANLQNAGIATGGIVAGLQGMMGGATLSNYATQIDPTTGVVTGDSGALLQGARFDFSNQSDISGEAKGAGISGKLGMTYKVNKNLTVGASYHMKTNMGDLETNDAALAVTLNGTPTTVTGKIAVNDFQFPAQFAFGMAYKQDKWMIAADVKVIQWADVMDSFRMTFVADNIPANGPFAGQDLNVEMFQNWDDQTVIQVGGAYKVTSATTLRAGVNNASNPVPNATVNPLFPATVESSYTLGVGHAITKKSEVNFSMTIAPEVEVTGGSGVTTTHAQTNWQLMYTQKF